MRRRSRGLCLEVSNKSGYCSDIVRDRKRKSRHWLNLVAVARAPLASSLLSTGNADSEDKINMRRYPGGKPLCRYVPR